MEYPTMYNSWYECSRDAHVESVKLLSKMGYKNVNDYKVGTKYHCKAVESLLTLRQNCDNRKFLPYSYPLFLSQDSFVQYQPAICTLELFKTQP